MSMISAQCEKLRDMAESVGLAMPQAATLMMEAADTIWELRESVHRERADADGLRMRITSLEAALEGMHIIREQDMDENAMLREIIADLEEFLPESERWYSHETVKAISENNAKLRELVRDMFRDFANADYELKCNHGKTFMAVTRYEPRLQELGIKVDV